MFWNWVFYMAVVMIPCLESNHSSVQQHPAYVHIAQNKGFPVCEVEEIYGTIVLRRPFILITKTEGRMTSPAALMPVSWALWGRVLRGSWCPVRGS